MNIETVASTEPTRKPWQVGEILAEVLLEDTENATFPWPPSWDKRTASASLPGPDIIGFRTRLLTDLHQERSDSKPFWA